MPSIQRIKQVLVFFSVVTLLVGLCLVIWPTISATTLCTLLGVVLTLVGIARIACYLHRGIYQPIYRYSLPCGLVDTLIGVLLLLHPYDATALFPLLIGVLMVADGIFKLSLSIEYCHRKIGGWWKSMLLALLGIVLGFLLLLHPFESAAVIMTLVGVALIADSVQNLYVILRTAARVQKLIAQENSAVTADYIDVDYEDVE
jgi:uncharacterized membrane protein HdeD (DUF308 family)